MYMHIIYTVCVQPQMSSSRHQWCWYSSASWWNSGMTCRISSNSTFRQYVGFISCYYRWHAWGMFLDYNLRACIILYFLSRYECSPLIGRVLSVERELESTFWNQLHGMGFKPKTFLSMLLPLEGTQAWMGWLFKHKLCHILFCRLQSLQGRLKTVRDRRQRLKFLEDTVVSGGCEQSDANVGVTARTPRLSTEQGTA